VAGIASVPLRLATRRDIIEGPSADLLLEFGRSSMLYGHGREAEFDWHGLETMTALLCVSGRRKFDTEDESLPFFVHKHESFSTCQRLLQTLRTKVPQCSFDCLQLKREMQLKREIGHASLVLSALEDLVSFVSKTGGHPHESLKEYAAAWLSPTSLARIPWELESMQSLRLEHLEDLYEGVEDTISDFLLESVDSAYCVPVPEHVFQEVCQFCDIAGGHAHVLHVLKRIMIRFLTTQGLSCETPVSELVELVKWPSVDLPAHDVEFPSEFLAAHCYQTYQRLTGLGRSSPNVQGAERSSDPTDLPTAVGEITGHLQGPAGGGATTRLKPKKKRRSYY
jgi:hypothetical protein